MTAAANAPGDSAEQREVEALLVAGLAQQLGVRLKKERLSLPDGGRPEVDGFSDSPPIVCEAWAHIGPAKSAQKNKLLSDAFKLLYVGTFYPNARKMLVLADHDAARHLSGTGWSVQALKKFGIEVHTVTLAQSVRNALRAAQQRQFR